jgi:hypothetical protein
LASAGALVSHEPHHLLRVMSYQANFFSALGLSNSMERAKFRAQREDRSFEPRPKFPRVKVIERLQGTDDVSSSWVRVVRATQGLANSHERHIVTLEGGEQAIICFDTEWLDFLTHGPARLRERVAGSGPWRPKPNLVIAPPNVLKKLAPTNWWSWRERELSDFNEVAQMHLPGLTAAKWITGHGDVAEDLVIAATRFAYRARDIGHFLPYPMHVYPAGHNDGGADFVVKHTGKKQLHIGSVKGGGARQITDLKYTKADAWNAVHGSVAKSRNEQGLKEAFNRRKSHSILLGVRHPDGGTFDSQAFRSIMVMGKRLVLPVHEDGFLNGWVYAPGPSGEPDYLPTIVPIFPIHFLALAD